MSDQSKVSGEEIPRLRNQNRLLQDSIVSLQKKNEELEKEKQFVWAVRCSNYEPMEIDSFWSTCELANERCRQLLKEQMWRVCKIAIQSTTSPESK